MKPALLSLAVLSSIAKAQSPYDFIYQNRHASETYEENEQQIAEKIIAAGAKAQVLAEKNTIVRRDAHAKSHGCVVGKFSVINTEDLPADLKVGIWAKNQSYKSWIRFSNGKSSVQPDTVLDGRGMAIQLTGVEGEKAIPQEVEKDIHKLQDFVMINHPRFFVKNTTDYVYFFKNPADFFSVRKLESEIAVATAGKPFFNSLKSDYFSMVPYGLGSKNAYKFFVKGVSCEVGNDVEYEENRTHPNLLRLNLQKHLTKSSACFDFYIQPFVSQEKTPIEDPRISWFGQSPSIKVASIEISRQAFTSIDSNGDVIPNEQDRACENTAYTPWHSLKLNKPLGGINRTRGVVYREVSNLRRKENRAEQSEAAYQNRHPVDVDFSVKK